MLDYFDVLFVCNHEVLWLEHTIAATYETSTDQIFAIGVGHLALS